MSLKKKKCVAYMTCQNGNEGCYTREPEKCVRFLPVKGTNLTKLSYVIETPPHIDWEACSDMFGNWVDSLGWKMCGYSEKVENEE
jgi:hypothetical protein